MHHCEITNLEINTCLFFLDGFYYFFFLLLQKTTCISSLKSENYLRLTDFKIMQKIWYLELRASFILYEKLLFLKLYCFIEITCYLSTRKTVLPFSMKTFGGGGDNKYFLQFKEQFVAFETGILTVIYVISVLKQDFDK